MIYSAIEHRTTDQYCYALDENRIAVNIRTGYDIDKCFIIHGDPFASGIMGSSTKWQGERTEITDKIRLQHHLLWQFAAVLPFKRCKYYFELHAQDEVMYYFEDGFYTPEELEQESHIWQMFFFPWLNPCDINTPPSWANDIVWYQIFPDRFCSGNPKISPKGVLPWASPDTPVNNTQHYGGDLYGITQKLDYLKALGVGGIYMTPINLAGSVHKYDTMDYEQIDPDFGDKEAFRTLVSEAHKRGIRVMPDGVFNHTSWQHPMWRDVVKNGRASPYYDWYMVNEWPFDERHFDNAHKGRFYSFAFFDGMPKLNTNNPAVIEYIINLVCTWIEEYDIDGIRLDVANEISHVLCREMHRRFKALKPDFYIMGEIWHNSIDWLRGEQFDSVMNYPFGQSVADYFCSTKRCARDFETEMNRCFTMYSEQTRNVLFNMLDSHDTIRLINRTHNRDKYYQQMAILFTMPGSACIYYGSEVILEGGHDPDCRRCMPWAEIERGLYDDRIACMKQLIALRKNHPAARKGKLVFVPINDNGRTIHYRRIYGNEVLEVIVNADTNPLHIEDNGMILFSNLYENQTLKADGVLVRLLEK